MSLCTESHPCQSPYGCSNLSYTPRCSECRMHFCGDDECYRVFSADYHTTKSDWSPTQFKEFKKVRLCDNDNCYLPYFQRLNPNAHECGGCGLVHTLYYGVCDNCRECEMWCECE